MTENRATITFLGAAGTVSGSRHLVATEKSRILLDCGLFQGAKALRLRNWSAPAGALRTVDAILLSHGHLDHSGFLPVLVKNGFRGTIHCTPGTADLLGVLLADSAHLQEEDAARANRRGTSKHHPALPLYTTADVVQTLKLIQPHAFGTRFAVSADATGLFRCAGHILGASTVELDLATPAQTRVVFSGDLGRWGRPILRDPALVSRADVLLIESTYGDRVHPAGPEARLAEVITRTAAQGGVVVIPAFCVGRTQDLLYTLRALEDAGTLAPLPVFVDSPMAHEVTAIYARHAEEHDLETTQLVDERRNPLRPRHLQLVRSVEESRALNDETGPMIIIAGSGMATGGRVLHHLHARLPDPRNTVLLTGFQAEGTRGHTLQQGAPLLKMHGEWVPVRAAVVAIDGLSAHADRDELLRWLRGFDEPPRETYVVHGEPQAASGLVAAIRAELRWDNVRVAADGATVSI